jgi:hypothetical protein
MKLDLMSPTVGANYHGFTTGFNSRVAHGCEEQWYAMDTRVYIGSGLREDKKTYVLCALV